MRVVPILVTLSMAFSSFGGMERSHLYSKMNGHSDQVKMLVGEQLKYSYPQTAIDKILMSGETAALELSEEGELDIFDIFGSDEPEKPKPIEKKYINYLNAYEKYNRDLENYSNANLATGTSRAVKGGIVMATAALGVTATVASGGLLAPVAIAAAGYVATELTDEISEGVQRSTKDETIKILGNFLKISVDEEGQELLRDLSPENLQELDEKFGLQDKLNNLEICDNCDPKKEAHLRNAMVKNLTNIVKGNTHDIAKLKKTISTLGDDVETNKNNIINIGNRLDEYGKKLSSYGVTLANIQTKMATNQKDINDKLKGMTSLISKNTKKIDQNKAHILENQKDIKFVKDFMYSKMSPAQKLMALKSGAYGKNMLDEKKELLVKQLEFQTNVGDFLNGARQVSQIASNLGINLGKFDEVIGVGTSAFNAATKLMSPNPDFLGAAVAITGIFAKRRDVNGIRHQQIMKALGVINKKLDAVLENQIKILKGQEKILKGLEQISRQIHESTITLYDRIELVRLDVKDNKRGIREGLRQPITACNEFIYNLKLILKEPLESSPLKVRANHFEDREFIFNKCREITGIISKYKEESEASVLFSKAYEDLHQDVAKNTYIKEFYQPLVSYFKQLAEDEEKFKKYFVLGMTTFNDPISLYQYTESIENSDHYEKILENEKWQNFDEDQLNLVRLLNNPLSDKAVVEISKIINQIFMYFDLVKDGSFPSSVEEILNTRNSGKYSLGYTYLKYVDVLVDTNIVQMNLLNGQVLIPLMYKNLLKGEKLDIIGKVFEKSEVIKENFLTYLITNRMYEKSKVSYYSSLRNSSPYERALKVKKDFLIEDSLNIKGHDHLKVVCNEKCQLKIFKKDEADFTVDLISLSQRSNVNKLTLYPGLKSLLGWSHVTKENMLGYTYEKDLRKEVGESAAMHYRSMIFNSSKALPRENSRAFQRNYNRSLNEM